MLGIIGGSGLYEIDGVTIKDEIIISTPYGITSDSIIKAEYEGNEFYFLPRHGKGHRLLPTEIPVKANIWALKSLGVDKLLSVSAVGSLKEEVVPGSFLLPDQFLDRTKVRENTFFGEGVVAHISFAEPTCKSFRNEIASILKEKEYPYHEKGTYVCIEGPQFSTKAESNFYRLLQADIIGMTAIPEAKLAREAQMCYVLMALVTDYDVWREGESVSVEQVVKTLQQNVDKAQEVIKTILKKGLNFECETNCRHSLTNAIMTDKNSLSAEKLKEIEVLLK
jgi:5'-methylthioadenosine phosphorylase